MRRFSRVTLSVLALALLPVAAEAKFKRAGEPTVEFVAVGPAGMKIKGVTHELEVADGDADVVVKVPLGGLKTGISLRDNHMRDKYLEVGKFPNAELKVSRGDLKLPGSGDAKGSMTIRKITKPVTFHYEATKSGAGIHVKGTVKLNMKDYGIDVPSYLGVTVKPDVDVNVEFDAKEG